VRHAKRQIYVLVMAVNPSRRTFGVSLSASCAGSNWDEAHDPLKPGRTMIEKRILLVEDEATTREIMTELLRLKGYAIDSVATAGAAATCLQTIPYALVIADWVLPDGDGIDVADSAAHLGAQTLVVTAHISGLPEGVAERHRTLSKPVNHQEVLTIIRDAIGPPNP
jgi:DNA-binding NtrC family response regulator